MNANMKWVKGMQFECFNRSHKVTIDASNDHGGSDLGPTPKELVLNAMMGCTAMDVVAILNKMRTPPEKFEMRIEVEKSKDHPIHFTSAILYFEITGNVPEEKALKAINSSLTKYCGVNYMMSKTCEIKYKLSLNGIETSEGFAKFEN